MTRHSDIAAIVENDTERDRKACISLDLKVTGANRELAQWLLDHPRYSAPIVADWLDCGETRIKDLRRWAENGFENKPFRPGNRRARADAPLIPLKNPATEEESTVSVSVSDVSKSPVVDAIQYSLLDQVKPPILQMNDRTRDAFEIWFREIHHHEIAF